MKKILFFLFISVSAFSQGPELYHGFENTLIDRAGQHDLVIRNSANYSSAYKIEGSYGGEFNVVQKNRMVTANKVDLSSGGFTIVFAVRQGNTGSVRTIMGSQPTIVSKGWRVDYDEVNQRIVFVQHNGTTSGSSYSANSSCTASQWIKVAIRSYDADGQYASIWINGALSGTDSTTLASSATNDSISVGALRNGDNTLYGRVDNWSIYKCALTPAKIAELHANMASNYTVDCGATCPALSGGVIAANQLIDSGNDVAAFTSTSSASGGSGTIVYTWQYSTSSSSPGSGTWADETSSNSTTFDHGTVAVPTYFVRRAVDACAIPQTAYSNVLTVNINTPTLPADIGVLSHDQVGVTYAGASNNDVVTVFDPWYPTADTTSGTFSYALTDDEGGIYAIDGSTGVVTIADNSSLVAGTDSLTVRVSLSGRYIDYSLVIRVMATANCYFIDPTAGDGGAGTRASPWNTFAGKTFSAGKAYLIKRGTTYTGVMTDAVYPSAGIIAKTSGTSGNEIIYGSYGVGTRPIISSGVSTYGIEIIANYLWIMEVDFFNCRNGILKRNAGLKLHHTTLSDIELNDAGAVNGQIFWQAIDLTFAYSTYDNMFDIYTHHGDEYGIKIENGYNTIRNIKAAYNARYGVSLATTSNHTELSGLVSEGNGIYTLEMSGPHNHVSYSILRGAPGYANIEFDDFTSGKSRIDHCIIYNSNGRALIHLRAGENAADEFVAAGTGGRTGFIIEDNILYNAGSGVPAIGIYYRVDSVVIRRNKIYGSPTGVLINPSIAPVYGYWIDHNVFYSNTTDILGSAGSKIYVYGNTCDGTINLSSSTGEVVRNNVYKTLTGTIATQSNNVDIDAITTATTFVNYAGHDYRLLSSAADLIDKGYSLASTYDFLGVAVPQGLLHDIGAFEYVKALPPPPPIIPTVKNRVIFIRL